MRYAPRWIIGGTIAAAAVAAVTAAVPAMAQQSGGQHRSPAAHVSPVCTVPGGPKVIPATAVPIPGKPVIAGSTGKTVAAPGAVRIVAAPGNPRPGHVTMATATPVKVKPVTVCPAGTTGQAPSTTTLSPR